MALGLAASSPTLAVHGGSPMTKLGAWKKACAVLMFCAAMVTASPAQIFKTLAKFDGPNGANPLYVSLVQGSDGGYMGQLKLAVQTITAMAAVARSSRSPPAEP